MPTLKERVETAIKTILKDQSLFHQVVHGDKTTEVPTAGGNVKSLAKAVGDLETSATNSATAAAGSATQSAGSATQAQTAAQMATTQATQSAQSATAAAGSATAAQTRATSAAASEKVAMASATGAASSQATAKTSETNAAASAATATGAATRATGRIATKAQAEKGKDNSHLMTPERTAQAIKALAKNYSQKKVIHVSSGGPVWEINYRSGNSASADIMQFDRWVDSNLTGIADGIVGRELLLQCTGSAAVTLKHLSSRSSKENRIFLPPYAFPKAEARMRWGDLATLFYTDIGSGMGLGWVLTGLINEVPPPEVSAGAIVPFAGASIPAGYLLCDGARLLSRTYRDLYRAIGSNFGASGRGYFSLPDLRGEFLRGYDRGRGVDSGRVWGSAQEGSRHAINIGASIVGLKGSVGARNLDPAPSSRDTMPYYFLNTNNYGGTQRIGWARPRNIAVNYIIKY